MWAEIISAASSVLGKAAAPAPPAGPSLSGVGGVVLGFDNSGWTVATSGGRAIATAGDRGGLTGAVTVPPAPGPIVLPDGTVINGTVTPAPVAA